MKESQVFIDTQKSLNSAWTHYEKLLKAVRKNPNRKDVHDFRNAVQRLTAVLDLSSRLHPSSLSNQLIQELQEERKSLGPLRKAQVEMNLLKDFKKEDFYQFLKKRKAKIKKKALKALSKISLKDHRSKMMEIEKKLFEAEKAQSQRPATEKLKSEVLSQEKKFERALPKDMDLPPQKLHQLRIAAKEILYEALALKNITGQTVTDVSKFEKIHDLVGDVQNDAVLLKMIDRYLSKKKHSKDTLAADLRIDLQEDQRRLATEAVECMRTTQWRQ